MNIEMVDVIDEHDVVIGAVTREEMRRAILRHRSVFIVVVNDNDEILVHRRSRDKDIWPGWLDFAVGGVLRSGESYENAAQREIFEEIGIEDPDLDDLDGGVARAYDDENVSLLGRCFMLRHNGPFEFRDGEVEDAWWMAIGELEGVLEAGESGEPFLPDTRALLLDYVLALLDHRTS